MLFNTLLRAREAGVDNLENYIKYDMTQSPEVIKLNKSGIPFIQSLLKTTNFTKFVKILELNHIKFLQIMGAIYKFTYDTHFITKIVETDLKLQNLVMDKFRLYFSAPPSFTFLDLEKLIKESTGYWFIPWIITYTTSGRQNLVRHNLNYDSDYVREWIKSNAVPEYYSACDDVFLRNDVSLCQTGKRVDILKGNTYYKPIKNGIFENLMKKYGKEVVAGPSGSSVMTFQLLFNILKICKGTQDKVMLLLCIIGDYYPVHHSIPEILMIYPEEAGLSQKYDLSMEPLDYLSRVVGDLIPELNYSFGFNKADCDMDYFSSLDKFLDLVIKQRKYHPDLLKIRKSAVRDCKPLGMTDCKIDCFHPHPKTIQVILGRFDLISTCFTDCKGIYTSLNLDTWSIFRNDLFIRYIMTHHNGLDSIFPIRVILSTNPNNFISPYNSRQIKHLQLLLNEYFTEYTWNPKEFDTKNSKKKIKPNTENPLLRQDMKKFSKYMTRDLKDSLVAYPSSNVTARELCILSKLHFYLVKKDGKYLSFLLLSKYDIKYINEWYRKTGKDIDGELVEFN